MGFERFELLELRRDDGIQTFHAREVSTARPVQVHLLVDGRTPENAELLSRLDYLPENERRRIVDLGESDGRPYVVTDRLAGFASFREWVEAKTTKRPAATQGISLDQQFFALFEPDEPAAASRLTWQDTAKSLLAMILGIVGAFVVLGVILAVIVLR